MAKHCKEPCEMSLENIYFFDENADIFMHSNWKVFLFQVTLSTASFQFSLLLSSQLVLRGSIFETKLFN